MGDRAEVRRFLVRGKVQGVFFRAATADEAERLGIAGWAKNLPDGRVEVVARGPIEALDELAQWLWVGSPRSVVTSVKIEQYLGPVSGSFAVL